MFNTHLPPLPLYTLTHLTPPLCAFTKKREKVFFDNFFVFCCQNVQLFFPCDRYCLRWWKLTFFGCNFNNKKFLNFKKIFDKNKYYLFRSFCWQKSKKNWRISPQVKTEKSIFCQFKYLMVQHDTIFQFEEFKPTNNLDLGVFLWPDTNLFYKIFIFIKYKMNIFNVFMFFLAFSAIIFCARTEIVSPSLPLRDRDSNPRPLSIFNLKPLP